MVRAARDAGVSLRTARRWLSRYREAGVSGLGRRERADRGRHRLPGELVALVEGLALTRSRPSAATITRQVAQAATAHDWPVPSYSTIYAIVAGLDPHLVTLAHEGPAGLRDRYELVYRRQSERPNDVWQADHTELDILVLDEAGHPARPWLTVVLDDCSRAVAGYSVFLGAPSALNLSLALRQAIWRKSDPAWARARLAERPVRRPRQRLHQRPHHHRGRRPAHPDRPLHRRAPQGRGKVERFMGSVTTRLLPELPGHLVRGHPPATPRLTLPQLDVALGRWITGTYHQRPHSETGIPPQQAGLADGWLPRTPDSLEALDLLLVMVAKPRVIHRDGIHFQGLRYLDPTMAAYVREPVTIRYDPRDLGEIRVFHHNQFLCRAISPEHAGQPITLKDIQAARTAHRRALRGQLDKRRATVAEYLPRHPSDPEVPAVSRQRATTARPAMSTPRLRAYLEDLTDNHTDADLDDDERNEP